MYISRHTCACRIVDVAFFWCATWSLSVMEELRLRSCENRLKRKAFVTKRKEGKKEGKKEGRKEGKKEGRKERRKEGY